MSRHGGAGRIGREEEEMALPSQRLVDAALSGDVEGVEESLGEDGEGVDVNYVGTVTLRAKCTDTVLHEESADEVSIRYEEFRTDVSALFAAAHSGHAEVVRRLLSAGANVNQQVFRGYATTAAAREGHCDILDMLLKAGASQPACEDALLEASLYGEAEAVEILICSEMAGSDAAAHALVTASCRGFVDVVTTLIKNGVDMNCMDRVLLLSLKPALHANVNCTPLVAAIVSRQVSVVRCLLETGARPDCQVRVGAWSWDPISGEELRVGACLGDPYSAAWCAIEYYEATGEILTLLLHHDPSLLERPHLGRTLLCHAILCQNTRACHMLLEAGANPKFPISTLSGSESFAFHLAARIGCLNILRKMISHGCDVNSRTSGGETCLIIAARADHEDCFLELLKAGADLGLASNAGESAMQLAKKSAFGPSVIEMLSQAMIFGAHIYSTDLSVFSPLHFVAESGNAELLQMILRSSIGDLNKFDGSGFTPVMVAAKAGHIEVFRLLVMAGADISVETPAGKTLLSMLHSDDVAAFRDRFEEILLSSVLANVIVDHKTFRALHYASRRGDLASLVQLLKMAYQVDSLDQDGYSPLMLAAVEGHSEACRILLFQGGADCELMNDRKETALSLARRSSKSDKLTEGVILDHMARSHVLAGEELYKHTREGRGAPHRKMVRMLKSGIMTWGRSKRRNVACNEAASGPGANFLRSLRKDEDDEKGLIFRVVTVTGRVVHFEARSVSNLELWVRGVNLIVKEATASGS